MHVLCSDTGSHRNRQDSNDAFFFYHDYFVCFLTHGEIANKYREKKTIQTSGYSKELKLSNALFKLNLHCLHCILAVPDDDFCSSDQMQQSFLPFLLQPCFLPGQTCQKVCEESLTSLHSLTYLEL